MSHKERDFRMDREAMMLAQAERQLGDVRSHHCFDQCPKCGQEQLFRIYCIGKQLIGESRCPVLGEHLHGFCGTPGVPNGCGFSWLEQTADNQPKLSLV